MIVVILPSASRDLADGSDFYEERESGAGSYFLESLFSDITGSCQSDSLTRSTTMSKAK
jgi:hypothetical protein